MCNGPNPYINHGSNPDTDNYATLDNKLRKGRFEARIAKERGASSGAALKEGDNGGGNGNGCSNDGCGGPARKMKPAVMAVERWFMRYVLLYISNDHSNLLAHFAAQSLSMLRATLLSVSPLSVLF
jgi:hypothetical protein